MKHKFRIDFIALVVLLSFFAGCDGTFSLTKPITDPPVSTATDEEYRGEVTYSQTSDTDTGNNDSQSITSASEEISEKTAEETEAITEVQTDASEPVEISNATVESGSKTVYLTFDDGPSGKYSAQILDILEERGIKATFFTLGTYVDRNPEIVKRMKDEGHMVGCHTYSHDYSSVYSGAEGFENEIKMWESSMEKALGSIPEEKLFRFPGGSASKETGYAKEILFGMGYKGFDWNAVSNDCLLSSKPEDMTDEEYLKDSLISSLEYSFNLKTSPHIILMHETYFQTVEMLEWTIDYLTDQGCSFGTLDQLDSSWYF